MEGIEGSRERGLLTLLDTKKLEKKRSETKKRVRKKTEWKRGVRRNDHMLRGSNTKRKIVEIVFKSLKLPSDEDNIETSKPKVVMRNWWTQLKVVSMALILSANLQCTYHSGTSQHHVKAHCHLASGDMKGLQAQQVLLAAERTWIDLKLRHRDRHVQDACTVRPCRYPVMLIHIR